MLPNENQILMILIVFNPKLLFVHCILSTWFLRAMKNILGTSIQRNCTDISVGVIFLGIEKLLRWIYLPRTAENITNQKPEIS